MKILVIMSTYNGEKYLVNQLNSIVGQEGCEVQVIVRDDGSEDNTLKILMEYEEKGALKVIKGENIGPAKSFLNVLSSADSEADYYAFADQDDVWRQGKLSEAVQLLQRYTQDTPLLYCSNLCAVDEKLNIIKDKLLPPKIIMEYENLLVNSSQLFGCTMVFNRKLKDIISGYGIPKRVIMHDLWTGILAACMGKIIYDETPYIYYRQHNSNSNGAYLTWVNRWKGRIKRVYKNNVSITEQAEEVIHCLGPEILKKYGKWQYTTMVANYKKSLINRINYIRKARTGLKRKAYIMHILLALNGKV